MVVVEEAEDSTEGRKVVIFVDHAGYLARFNALLAERMRAVSTKYVEVTVTTYTVTEIPKAQTPAHCHERRGKGEKKRNKKDRWR